MATVITDKHAAIRAAYVTFSHGERERCLAHIRQHLADEGFVDLTDVELDQILLARACGGLPFDGLPTQQPEQAPVEPAGQDGQDDDCADLLEGHGVCRRCD